MIIKGKLILTIKIAIIIIIMFRRCPSPLMISTKVLTTTLLATTLLSIKTIIAIKTKEHPAQ